MRSIQRIIGVGLVVLVSVLVSRAGAGEAGAEGKGPELTFAQEGPDLVVTAKVTVNNSPHVAWTSSFVNGSARRVALRYVVVQNRDLLVRSQKQVELRWRLPGRRHDGAADYRVEATHLDPTTDELKDLLPQLQQLAAQGDAMKQARGRPVPAPAE